MKRDSDISMKLRDMDGVGPVLSDTVSRQLHPVMGLIMMIMMMMSAKVKECLHACLYK